LQSCEKQFIVAFAHTPKYYCLQPIITVGLS
jgi:hypothetical protein